MIVNGADSQLGQAGEAGALPVDLEALTEEVCRHIKQSDPAEVRQVLSRLLPKYESVPIQMYIHVLMYKEAIDILRH
jgi:hypothetical protein